MAIQVEFPAPIEHLRRSLLPSTLRPRNAFPRQVFGDHSKTAVVIVDFQLHARRQMFRDPFTHLARLQLLLRWEPTRYFLIFRCPLPGRRLPKRNVRKLRVRRFFVFLPGLLLAERRIVVVNLIWSPTPPALQPS